MRRWFCQPRPCRLPKPSPWTRTRNSRRASGRRASVEGYERIESDFVIHLQKERFTKNYRLLSKDVRDVYEGFAAGINRFVELHPDKFPAGMPSDFTGQDVAATELSAPPARKIRAFLERLNPQPISAIKPANARNAMTTTQVGNRRGLETGLSAESVI